MEMTTILFWRLMLLILVHERDARASEKEIMEMTTIVF